MKFQSLAIAAVLLLLLSDDAEAGRKRRKNYRPRRKFKARDFQRVNLMKQPYLQGPQQSPAGIAHNPIPPPISYTSLSGAPGAPGTSGPSQIRYTNERRPLSESNFGDGTAPERQQYENLAADSSMNTPPDPDMIGQKVVSAEDMNMKEREKIALVRLRARVWFA